MGCITTPIHQKRSSDNEVALPDNIIEAIKEDDKTCTQDIADARARPDASLYESPDPNWPEYPVNPIDPKQRAPEPPSNPLVPPTPGTSLYIERCITQRLPYLYPGGSGDTVCTCPPGNGKGTVDPPVTPGPVDDGTGCPRVCNPHANTCHLPSAQNCVFPAPLESANPRSYCACRPGFKGAYGQDTSKHWRVKTLGIENFVWVAEGVECNEQCSDVMCSEVPVLEKPCV